MPRIDNRNRRRGHQKHVAAYTNITQKQKLTSDNSGAIKTGPWLKNHLEFLQQAGARAVEIQDCEKGELSIDQGISFSVKLVGVSPKLKRQSATVELYSDGTFTIAKKPKNINEKLEAVLDNLKWYHEETCFEKPGKESLVGINPLRKRPQQRLII